MLKYGANISYTNKKVALEEDSKWYKYINLSKTKRLCIMIFGDKTECLRAYPNTLIYSTGMPGKKSLITESCSNNYCITTYEK